MPVFCFVLIFFLILVFGQSLLSGIMCVDSFVRLLLQN